MNDLVKIGNKIIRLNDVVAAEYSQEKNKKGADLKVYLRGGFELLLHDEEATNLWQILNNLMP
jgi:hypothetical protein